MAEGMAKQSGALLLGRRTHENFYASWPRPTDNPYTDRLNKTTKYVASRTLTEPLPWSNSILLGCDAAGAIAELKQQPIGGLTMTGSGELIGSLLATSETDVTVAVEPRFALGMRIASRSEVARFDRLRAIAKTWLVAAATVVRRTPGGADSDGRGGCALGSGLGPG